MGKGTAFFIRYAWGCRTSGHPEVHAVQGMRGTPAAQLVQRSHTAFQNSLIVFHPVDALVFRRLVFEAQDGIPRRIV